MVSCYWSADNLIWQVSIDHSGAPKGRQAEPHTHIGNKRKPMSYLMVIMVSGPDDDDDDDGGVAQDGGHPPNNRLTGTWSLGLPCTSLTLDIHVMINWHLWKQDICWPVSRDHIAGPSLQLIEVMCFFEVNRWQSAGFSIGSRAHARLTCWKYDRIVWKPVNASLRLKFIWIVTYKTQIKILPFPSWVSCGHWTARPRSYAFRQA